MPKLLSDDAVAAYQRNGYHFPVDVLTEAETLDLRRRLEAHEAAAGGPIQGDRRHKAHLYLTWLNDLIRHPRILDAAEDVLGPNLLCWSTSFFIKEASDAGFVSWHQDATYWGLEPPDIVTAWVALSPSTVASGCLRVVPGSHRWPIMPHRETFADHNLLSRGQEIEIDVTGRPVTDVVLGPGQMSLHHVRLIHGSDPNPSGKRRIGFAIRYLPTHVRQTVGTNDSATLVRGVDRFNNFAPERAPDADLSEAAISFHAAVMGDQQKVLMNNAQIAAIR